MTDIKRIIPIASCVIDALAHSVWLMFSQAFRRPPTAQHTALWAGVCLVGLLVAANRLVGGLSLPWPLPLVERDFTNLWLAGRLALEGQIAIIFDPDAFRDLTQTTFGTRFLNNYSYPPHALFLALPFGAMPYWLALLTWNAASLALFYWAARPYFPEALPRWVAIFSPASMMCLVYGHYGLICGALWLWAFRGNGFAAAALTIKPHLGLLVAVQMLRNRKTLRVAVLATLALIIASVVAFGVEPWRAFFTSAFGYQVGLLDGSRPTLATNMVTPLITYGLMGQLAFGGAAIALLWKRFDVFSAATATFLIVPYGFHYDLTVVCLGFAVLLASRWDELPLGHKMVSLFAFLSPSLVLLGAWLIPPILLAGLFVQTRSGTTPAGGGGR